MRSLGTAQIRSMVTLIVVIILHVVLDTVYRPIAYSHSFQDLGFKDSFTQVTSVIGISSLMVILEKEKTWDSKTGKFLLVIIPVIAMVIYEFIQRYIPASKFDPQDLLYTFVGGIFAAFIQSKVIRLHI